MAGALIGGFVLKNLPAILIAGLLTGALGYVEVLRLEVAHDKKVIAADKVALATCVHNTSTLEAAVKAQNAATLAVSAEQARTQAAAAKALQQAKAARVTVSKQVAAIAAAKAGTDQCKSADQLILGSLPPSS